MITKFSQKGLTGDVEFIAEAYPVVEFGNYDIPEGLENALAKPTQTGVPAQWENPNTTGFESSSEEETNLYFFHTDHLGSTNYLTDKDGVVQQSLVYMPYGEILSETKTYSNPYKFNGKELDTETGLAYYGARYYAPELSIWYGVDPLMEKYPNSSPYVFCAGNPVKYIDPDGRKITFVGAEKDKETVCNIINESMGGFAKVTIPKRGPMIIENTNKEGQSTDMQQKSINEWSKIINGEGDAIINIHRNNPTILIGSYAKETIAKFKKCLSQILKKAKKEGLIEHNFASSDYIDIIKGAKKEILILNDEEAKIFKIALDTETNIQWKTALYILLTMGLRRSELCGLEWKDINFENNTMKIQRSSYDVAGVGLITKDPKTFTSRRELSMPECLVNVLKEYKTWYDDRKKILSDLWKNTDRLIISDEGNIIYPSTYAHWLRKILKRANITKKVTLHSLRHTNITLQLIAGVDLKTVSSRAGHARASTTTDIYSHFIRNSDCHASKILDDILNGKNIEL